MQQCHAPRLVAVTKFKTTKINFEGLFGLSTKIRPHENYTCHTVHLLILYTNGSQGVEQWAWENTGIQSSLCVPRVFLIG